MKTSFVRTAAASLLAMAVALSADAKTWDFSTVPDADQALLNADATGWKYESNNNRWLNQSTFTDSPLMANGTELSLTAGLKFTATGADNIRVDAKKGSVTLNKKTGSITIPGLKAGDKVTISAGSSSSSTARQLEYTNLTVVSGFTSSTDRQDNIGTVIADGDVTVNPTGGFYVYSITVDGEGGGTGGGGGTTPDPVSDHSVKMNPNAHQMLVTAAGGNLKYYNNADLASVDFDKAAGSVAISGKSGDWTDTYLNSVSAINFAKAQATAGDGEITNSGVNITEAKGWYESVYAKWDLLSEATSYKVYVKGGDYADFTPVDRELVRKYPSYGRVDVVGLPAGTYTVKVVPVIGGAEKADMASTAANMAVKAYDRQGFANMGGETAGAYDATGRLKPNARVLYLTAENAKTVSLEMKTSKGKTQVATGIQAILQLFEKGVEDRPLCVRLIGTVTAADVDYFESSAEGIQIKGKNYTPVNLTLEGIGDDATIHGFGFNIRNVSLVELRNFAIMWFMDDAVSINTNNSHIWVHHLDIFYGEPGSAKDQAKGDGTIDIKDDSQYITVAYNRLWDSGKASLCGMKSESGPNYIDYHHNWFDHSDSRHPRVRTMTVHVWNNYYDGVSKYGVGSTMGSSVFVESNFYRHTKNPMLISKQGTDAKGDGTFSGENGGVIKSYGNVYAEKGSGSNYTSITHLVSPTDFDCYEASSRDEQVPSTFKAKAGGTTYDNFDTNPSLMYTYTPDAAQDVPSVVCGYYGAGRLNKGDFTWEFNNATEDTNYDVIKALSDAIKVYKTTLVGIFE